MEQLSGLDSAFVLQDSWRTPMHICAVLVYDNGGEKRREITIDGLREIAGERLGSFPLFRRRLRRVALELDNPYWEEATPDWDRHLSESSLGAAGDWGTLQQLLARLHATRMNLALPLWEMHLVHGLRNLPGLPGHCQALVLKIHHSAIDGISMAAVVHALHEAGERAGASAGKSTLAPKSWEMWTRAHINSFTRQLKFADTMGKLLPGVMRARKTRQAFSDLPPVYPYQARFNARVHRGRSTGTLLMPNRELLAIKRAVRRVTLNDVAMAVVAGALREYLLRYGILPAKPLVAGVPINLREPGDDSTGGNRIATMAVGLATHIPDPVARLRLIHRYAVAGKKQIDALGSGTVMDVSDSVAPAVLAEGIRTMARASQIAEVPVPFHTMISNVPGPQDTLFLGEAELVTPIGLGPVRDNMGLFHIVSGGANITSLSFSACQKMLPDPDFYQRCMQRSFAALRSAAVYCE